MDKAANGINGSPLRPDLCFEIPGWLHAPHIISNNVDFNRLHILMKDKLIAIIVEIEAKVSLLCVLCIPIPSFLPSATG